MPQELRELLELYQNTLASQGFPAAEDRGMGTQTSDRRLSHLRWQIDHLMNEGKDWSAEKQMNVLGFIQGALWAEMQFSRVALEDHRERVAASFIAG